MADTAEKGGGQARTGAQSGQVVARARARVFADRTAEIRERLAITEDLLASGLTPKRASAELMKRCGISHRSAKRYLSAARAGLAAQAKMETPEQRAARKAHLEAILFNVVNTGFSRKKTLMNSRGDTYECDDPDLRSVIGAVDELARFNDLIGTPPGEQHNHLHLHGTAEERKAQMLTTLREGYLGAESLPPVLPVDVVVAGPGEDEARGDQ